MQRRGMWWKCAVYAATVSGCFSEPGDWGYPGGAGGEPSAGSGGSGPSDGSGGNAAGQGPSGGSGGNAAGQGAVGGSGNVAGQGAVGGSGNAAGQGAVGGSGNAAGHGPTGGTAGEGSGGRGGEGGSCSSADACGGDVAGTWTVASSCLEVGGALDITGLGLGCASARMSGSRVVAGTFIANANGTYVDQTTTSGEEQLELGEECLSVSGVIVTCDRLGPVFTGYGYDSVTCVDDPDSEGCLCNALFEQEGGMGVLALDASVSGTYRTSDDILTLVDEYAGPTDYAYCSSQDELVLVPRATETGELKGTIVLAKQ